MLEESLTERRIDHWEDQHKSWRHEIEIELENCLMMTAAETLTTSSSQLS